MDKCNTFIGIDPGKTGACAIIRYGMAAVADLDLKWGNFTDWFGDLDDWMGAIELPSTVQKQSTKSAQTLGIIIGRAQMLLEANGIEYVMVSPQKWKRAVFFGTPEGKGKLDKVAARKLAHRLFPSVDLGKRRDEGRAEALLIAYWLKREYGGAGKP